jgi:prolyl oligopeptidase
VINGGSNGGTLTTACANQRPDLYAAMVSQVPVTDMLRFQKFTIGHFWCSDFGNAEKDGGIDYLIKYSPLHNIQH